ncbi:MAG: RNA-directed DNA polymerase (reverse transcriptase) [uncultured bacterium]|nr:MAG: RNA-directed DNA polymerase (reverse transcriptase) [uncultured bacterium]
MKIVHNIFNQIISLENLFLAWKEFRRGKRSKLDVQEFERNLEDNLFNLHLSLKNQTYQHSDYTSFYITDPKLRLIHKARVCDRIVHHAVYLLLYPIFDKSFTFDSYSCRIQKGTHKAVYRLDGFTKKVSQNHFKPCFALKCDIKKFFASINQTVLINQIKQNIKDQDAMWLIQNIISSFKSAERESLLGKLDFRSEI